MQRHIFCVCSAFRATGKHRCHFKMRKDELCHGTLLEQDCRRITVIDPAGPPRRASRHVQSRGNGGDCTALIRRLSPIQTAADDTSAWPVNRPHDGHLTHPQSTYHVMYGIASVQEMWNTCSNQSSIMYTREAGPPHEHTRVFRDSKLIQSHRSSDPETSRFELLVCQRVQMLRKFVHTS